MTPCGLALSLVVAACTQTRGLNQSIAALSATMLDLHPYTLLICVVALVVAQQAVAAAGKPAIQRAAWRVYCRWGSAALLRQLHARQTELRDTVKQRNLISAQDQYARWTKLNRQADRLEAEVKALQEALGAQELLINRYVGYAITAATSLPLWFCRAWFRKTILFYLPPGVLPHPVEWALALPFVPTGGVGLTVWLFALNSVVGLVVELVKFELTAAPKTT